MGSSKIGTQRQGWRPRGVAFVIAFGILLLAPRAALAATCTAVANNWNSVASWTCVGGNHIPTAADDVIIPNNHTMTGNPATTILSLTLTGSGAVTLGADMIVTGALTLGGSGALDVGAQTFTLGGNCTGTANVSNATGTFVYGGAGAQSICGGTYRSNLSTAGSGTKTLIANLRQTGGRSITVGAGTTLDQANVNLTTSTGGMTVNGTFRNAGAGTLRTNGDLTINGTFQHTGTGTITLGGNLVNNGSLVIDNGGNGCNVGDARSTINSSGGARTWSGSGSFQVSDVTLTNQTSALAIGAYHSTGVAGSMVVVADCTGAPLGPTAVRFVSMSATAFGWRVLVQWRTAYEVDNVGFRLYREGSGSSAQVTPELIAGSGLLAGGGTSMHAGRSYAWWDDLPAGTDPNAVRYWVQDVDMNGTRTIHGPASPVVSSEAPPAKHQAALLRRLAAPAVGAGAHARHGWNGRHGGAMARFRMPGASGDLQAQWNLADDPALKIVIDHDGWYRVSGAALAIAGLGDANPRFLQLYADGREMPIDVAGLDRGRLAVGSTVEFYATGLDTPWTEGRTYWLVAGRRPGQRIARSSGGGQAAEAVSFPFVVEAKPRTLYFPALINGSTDKFFGPLVMSDATAPTVVMLDVHNADPAPTAEATLGVTLQGVTDGAHRVLVSLNGQSVGEVVFSGQAQGTVKIPVNQSLLQGGSNAVGLVAAAGEMDLSLVDVVGLTYLHTYNADGDVLRMSAAGGGSIVVGGFTSPTVRVVDVTDPERAVEVATHGLSQGSGYAVAVNVPATGTRTLLAFTDAKVDAPESIKANVPSSWHASRGADVVIITHASLKEAATRLAHLREAEGHSVALVDVEDVYDEFSFGNKTPQAMRDFLAFASQKWRMRPQFVVLAGSASADSRNLLGYGDTDLVPTKLVEATYNETASDDWFVDFDDDGLPNMAIGRLPVRDAIEAATVVDKLAGYGQADATGWQKTAVLVADTGDNTFDFEAASTQVASALPADMRLYTIYRSDFASDAAARDAVLGVFDMGAALVNYMGHGSDTAWRGNLISTADADALSNGSRLPFVVSMTCWTGWFDSPYGETLGESLLKAPRGGAIAVWASSGMTDPKGQTAMDRELVSRLFDGSRPTLGEAVARAKAATSDMDVRRTWILLGDPTTRLQ